MTVRLMFVYYVFEDAGSAQDIRNYARVAREFGHEVVVHGRDPGSSFELSKDVASADALIFAFEWTTDLRYGDHLDIARLVGRVPRERRVVIDCDGAYNDAIAVAGDYNHRDRAASERWIEVCDSLSDKICQPTLRPRRSNVRPFLFHAYDRSWEVPLDFSTKDYGMVYVGHSKFRWVPMQRVLDAVRPVRPQVGRIALVGHGWDALPWWAKPMSIEDHYYADRGYLRELEVEFVEPVPSPQVIAWMSRAIFNPVVYRPLFSHLDLVTCRTFETPAAGTIPVFALDPGYVREIYGEAASELVLPDDKATAKIMDVISRPEHYAHAVEEVRRHLSERHSYGARLRELIEIVES
jgi:hypothetical protein